jgi:excisionase family DNA binding protein
MTIGTAAEFTGFSTAYLYELVREKKIPHYKPLGGRIIFRKSEIEDFLFRNRVAADYEVSAVADDVLNGETRGAPVPAV